MWGKQKNKSEWTPVSLAEFMPPDVNVTENLGLAINYVIVSAVLTPLDRESSTVKVVKELKGDTPSKWNYQNAAILL